jgi:hypothetical protein
MIRIAEQLIAYKAGAGSAVAINRVAEATTSRGLYP